MKITDVKTYQLSVKVDQPFTSSRGWWYGMKSAMIIKVETDEGLVGWGEAYGPAAVSRAVIESLFKKQLIGRDPFDVEVIWEHLYNLIKDYGLSGMTISALSAVDIAMWDLMGKACGKPIHKLLGGCFRNPVTAYATGFYFTDLNRTLEDAVEEAQKYLAQGFKAMKMKIGLGDLRKDLKRVEAVRHVVGDEVKLMVDANHCFTVPQAITIGRELDKMGIYWFEEPISPEDLDGYQQVTQALDLAVAGGENEFTKFGFREIIARKAMDIVQPDVCAAGGITECKKIAAMAQAHWVECVPHAWGSAIGMAATLHFLASLPDCPPCLCPVPPLLEFEQTFNPFRDDLATVQITHQNGLVAVPEGPGLGIEINQEVIDKYLVKS